MTVSLLKASISTDSLNVLQLRRDRKQLENLGKIFNSACPGFKNAGFLERWQDDFERLVDHQCKITPELEFAVQTLANQKYQSHNDWQICEMCRFNQEVAWGKVTVKTRSHGSFQKDLEFTAEETISIAGMLRSKTVQNFEGDSSS